MAVPLKDLINRAPEELKEFFNLKKQECVYCGVPLQETITGKRHTDSGDACSDCYYAELGKIIENHPIVSPGIHRG